VSIAIGALKPGFYGNDTELVEVLRADKQSNGDIKIAYKWIFGGYAGNGEEVIITTRSPTLPWRLDPAPYVIEEWL